MTDRQTKITIADDGETGEISHLTFRSHSLHRLLSEVDGTNRPDIVHDALDVGAEVLARVSRRGDLEDLSRAVDKLDEEGKRVVERVVEKVDDLVAQTVDGLAESLGNSDGPLSEVFDRFDPAADGNVLDRFRDLVSTAIEKETKRAVADLAEATTQQVETLNKSLTVLEKAAAVEEAKLKEAEKGTAKGLDHETRVESLLGEIVGTTGDGLDDVSNVVGLVGNKKGDKVISPRGGCSIVTEDKSTRKFTESTARKVLGAAMENRGAELGMLIVEDESKVPGNQPYHLIDDDKIVVTADRLTLRLVYTYMRAKALQQAKEARQVDDSCIIETIDIISSHVEEMRQGLDRFKLIRTEHTKASKAIGQANKYVDEVAASTADGVEHIGRLVETIVRIDEIEAAS